MNAPKRTSHEGPQSRRGQPADGDQAPLISSGGRDEPGDRAGSADRTRRRRVAVGPRFARRARLESTRGGSSIDAGG